MPSEYPITFTPPVCYNCMKPKIVTILNTNTNLCMEHIGKYFDAKGHKKMTEDEIKVKINRLTGEGDIAVPYVIKEWKGLYLAGEHDVFSLATKLSSDYKSYKDELYNENKRLHIVNEALKGEIKALKLRLGDSIFT